MPSPKASINKMIAVPIAPKTMYSDISIRCLYLVFRFLIMVSIMIDEGIPNTITIGRIYITPNTKLPTTLLKVICSYWGSKDLTSNIKLPHKVATNVDMIFLII